jgi:methyl-accepting chemotaxis protein
VIAQKNIISTMLKRTLNRAVILYACVVLFISTVLIIRETVKARKQYMEAASRLIEEHARQKANQISTKLAENLAITKVMAHALNEVSILPEPQRYTHQRSIMEGVLKEHPEYTAVFLSWRLDLVDKNWKAPNGRQRVNYYYADGAIHESINLTDTARQESYEGIFHTVRSVGTTILSDPYEFEDYNNNSNALLLATSPCSPIYKDGQFQGVIGIDMVLDYFQPMTSISLYDKGFSFLVSSNGTIVAHPSKEVLNKPIQESGYQFENLYANHDDPDVISGYYLDNSLNEDVYISMVPVVISDGIKPWTVGVVVPVSEILKPIIGQLIINVVLGIIASLVVCMALYWTARKISTSLIKANDQLKRLAEGNLDDSNRLELNKVDRMMELGASVNQLMDQMNKRAEIAQQIGEGNLNVSIEVTNPHDLLGISLEKMRQNLTNVIDDIQQIIVMASIEGTWESSLDAESKSGAWHSLYITMNDLLTSISQPIHEMNRLAKSIAQGDLSSTYSLSASGEILLLKNNLNTAMDNLNSLLNSIVESSEFVGNSTNEMIFINTEMTQNSKEIATAISEMSRGAQDQVRKVDESSRLIEGVLFAARQVGIQTEEINTTAREVKENSESGYSLVNEVARTMSEVVKTSSATKDSMTSLLDQTNRMSHALAVITDIASQTNLLALNAAIEASQAGDYGRGFAVIAEEIRKLAEISKDSAQEIGVLIEKTKVDTSKASKTISLMYNDIAKGEGVASKASKFFIDITASSDLNLKNSNAIATDIQALIAKINNIVNLAEGVVVIAEQTAAGSEQVAASANQLSVGMQSYSDRAIKLKNISEELGQRLNKFKLKSIVNLHY